MSKLELAVGASRFAACAALGAFFGTHYMQAVGHHRFNRTHGAILGVASHVATVAVPKLWTWAHSNAYLNEHTNLRTFIVISPMFIMVPVIFCKKEDIFAISLIIGPLVNLVISNLGNAACNYFQLSAEHAYRKPFTFCRD